MVIEQVERDLIFGASGNCASEEGAWGGLRTKCKLIQHPLPPRWDVCDIPQALLAAQQQRKGKKTNGQLIEIIGIQNMGLHQFTNILVNYKKKAILSIA